MKVVSITAAALLVLGNLASLGITSDALGDEECRILGDPKVVLTQQKKILVATPLKNAADALGKFAEALNSLSYPKFLIRVAFLVSDSVDGTAEAARQLGSEQLRHFADVQVIEKDFNYVAPKDRHALTVQVERRKILARSRNALLEAALQPDVFAVLWLDVDVIRYPQSMIQDLLALGRPVVVPHVLIGSAGYGSDTYDRNSWKETQPEEAFAPGGPEVVFEGYEDWEEMKNARGRREHLDEIRARAMSTGLGASLGMVHGTWGYLDRYYGEKIDGVGSAALLVEARVHRAGANFPDEPYKHRLESEGFGLMAKDRGFQPCGYPFYDVRHVSETTPPPEGSVLLTSEAPSVVNPKLRSGYSKSHAGAATHAFHAFLKVTGSGATVAAIIFLVRQLCRRQMAKEAKST